jgi:hypothetical protein
MVRTQRTAPAARPTTTSRERQRSGSRSSLFVTAVTALIALTVMAGTIVASAMVAGPTSSAGAAGILPPANPGANTPQSSPDWLAAIANARALEGVGAMQINEAEFAQLPAAEQIFIALNFERIGRGLPPIMYMTSQLNASAGQGAARAGDPSVPTVLTGGVPLTGGGSIWAGEVSSSLAADYYWMYLDGPGTNSNLACMRGVDCWIHRDAILHGYPGCGGGPAQLSMGAAFDPTGYPGGSVAAVMASSCTEPADVTLTWPQALWATSATRVVGLASLPNGAGYWEAQANGTVAALGKAPNDGSVTSALNAPIVGLAATPDGGGYWLVAADGGVFSFGDAHFYGSTGSLRLNQPIVGLAPTPDGKGYWLVAADGGIFSYGDAAFRGSMGGMPLNEPVVGMASDAATGGYWEVAADGGIFSFDATFLGSTGSIRLNEPIVGMESTPNGLGYRFVAADGGIFSYGTATFEGSTGGLALVAPMVALAADDATGGYWMAAADGGIFNYGGAAYLGRATGSLVH